MANEKTFWVAETLSVSGLGLNDKINFLEFTFWSSFFLRQCHVLGFGGFLVVLRFVRGLRGASFTKSGRGDQLNLWSISLPRRSAKGLQFGSPGWPLTLGFAFS